MKKKYIQPFFSIITVTYNSESTISDTINSILIQTLQDFEFIIIDGNSNDKTLEIVNSFKGRFLEKKIKYIVLSEKDKGIYDAMNKGIKISNGKVVSILNSDDLYFDENVLNSVYEEFNKNKLVSILYGNLIYFNKSHGRFNRTWNTKPNSFLNGWNPPHPSTFVKKSIYAKIGLFNPKLYISSDYDFLLRAIHLNKVKNTHLDKVLVKMRLGGRSTKSLKNILNGWKEVYIILKSHRVASPLCILIKRIINKISYSLKLKKFL